LLLFLFFANNKHYYYITNITKKIKRLKRKLI